MKIIERRIVEQDWFESEDSKTGWEDGGWTFKDDGLFIEESVWHIVEYLDSDKFYNPILAVAEKETEI